MVPDTIWRRQQIQCTGKFGVSVFFSGVVIIAKKNKTKTEEQVHVLTFLIQTIRKTKTEFMFMQRFYLTKTTFLFTQAYITP